MRRATIRRRLLRFRTELSGWLFVGVLALLALFATLEILNVVSVFQARSDEKRTAAFCEKLQKDRNKRRRSRRR